MKKNKNISRTFISLIAVAGLLLGNVSLASEKGAPTMVKQGNAKVEKQVQDNTRSEAGKQRQSIVEEAVTALEQTNNAIKALVKKDKKAALEALALVTGKLELVLAREPELANAPIDVRVEQFDLYASVDTVKATVKEAADLLDDSEVQQARALLSGLSSEIDIIVTALPLKAYTEGIKDVAKLIDQEKYDEASSGLYDLLSTMVITRNIIPLPILRAEGLLTKADELAGKEGRSNEESKELVALLDNAKAQIEMAESLGYGDKKQYKAFYRKIKEIRKKTEGNKFGKDFMKELKDALKEFKETIFSHNNKIGEK